MIAASGGCFGIGGKNRPQTGNSIDLQRSAFGFRVVVEDVAVHQIEPLEQLFGALDEKLRRSSGEFFLEVMQRALTSCIRCGRRHGLVPFSSSEPTTDVWCRRAPSLHL